MPKLSDTELVAAIEAEEAVALDQHSGQLRQDRTEAWRRYRGEPLGNELEGRSQVVDRGVMDTIQWIVPSLVRIYLGGDDIGQFEPIGPEDEYAAQCETEVCNWYLQSKNDFYSHIVATLTDALLLKNGYLAGMWTRREDVMTEQYRGLADEELALLQGDEDVEIIEHTAYPDPIYALETSENAEYGAGPEPAGVPGPPLTGAMPAPAPPMLHDVKVERKKADEFVGIESVPPDEMLVSRRHRWTSLADADFVQWRRRVTIGQLRAEGFKIPEDVSDFTDLGTEQISRERFFDNAMTVADETPDPSRRIVLFKDTYLRIDLSGKGTPLLWRVAYVDGMTTPVLKEEAACVPFAAFAPIIYPHSHVGTSIFDLITDLSDITTMMQRQLIDGVYLQTAGRMGVNVDNVNVDDLLIARPGGMVRVEGPPGDSLFPITTPDVGPTVMSALEYLSTVKEGRTGVTRYSAGLDANTLNKTATGMQQIQAAANQRIELIARTLAGGFRDLFLIIHTLASKHSTKPVQMKLKGQWQAIDPRAWAKRSDFKINVGLGTGTPEQQLQKLFGFQPVMQQAMQLGLAGPTEAFNYGAELWKAAGYKNATKFLHEPEKKPKMDEKGQPVLGPDGQPVLEVQMPPPPPDPRVQVEQMKQQGEAQKFQAQTQADVQKHQATQQMDVQKFQAEQAAKQQAQAADAAAKEREQQNALVLQQSNDQRQAELDRQKHELAMHEATLKLQLDEGSHVRDIQAQIQIANIKAAAEVAKARIAAGQSDGAELLQAEERDAGYNIPKLIQGLTQTMAQLAAAHAAPKQVIRDQNGRVVGVAPANGAAGAPQ